VCRSKHVEQLRNTGIINSTTRLHLVGSFYEIYTTMHGSMNIKFAFTLVNVIHVLVLNLKKNTHEILIRVSGGTRSVNLLREGVLYERLGKGWGCRPRSSLFMQARVKSKINKLSLKRRRDLL